MTDAERAYRDAWLAEMWSVVPEYHPGVSTRRVDKVRWLLHPPAKHPRTRGVKR